MCLLSSFTFSFHFHALGKEMATHSSVLCMENLRDRGAWWAAVYEVAQLNMTAETAAAAAIRYIFLRIVSLIIYFYYFLRYQSMKIRNALKKTHHSSLNI